MMTPSGDSSSVWRVTVSWFRATSRSMPSREDIRGWSETPDPVEEMAAPDAGLVVLDEQDPAPLAHQDPGQETR